MADDKKSKGSFKKALGKIFSKETQPYWLTGLAGAGLGGGVGYLTGNALWKDPTVGQITTSAAIGAGGGSLAALALLAAIKDKQDPKKEYKIPGITNLNDIQEIKNSGPFNKALYGVTDTGNVAADVLGYGTSILNKSVPKSIPAGGLGLVSGLIVGNAGYQGMDQLIKRRKRKNIIFQAMLHDVGQKKDNKGLARLNSLLNHTPEQLAKYVEKNKKTISPQLKPLLLRLSKRKPRGLSKLFGSPTITQQYERWGMNQGEFLRFSRLMSKQPTSADSLSKAMGPNTKRDFSSSLNPIRHPGTRPLPQSRRAGALKLLGGLASMVLVGGATSRTTNSLLGDNTAYTIRQQLLSDRKDLSRQAKEVLEQLGQG